MNAAPPPFNVEKTQELATNAIARRDFDFAQSLLTALAENDPLNVVRWINLAAIHRVGGRLESALEALDKGLKVAPRDFFALLMRASILDRQGHRSGPEAYGFALAQQPVGLELDPPTQHAVQRAKLVHQKYTESLREHLHMRMYAAQSDCTASEKSKLAAFVDDSLRLRKRFHQEPLQFYYPGLPSIAFYERSLFPWLPDFEACARAISEDLHTIVGEGLDGFIPYVDYDESLPLDQWKGLNRNPDWGAFHLIKGGRVIDNNASRCPQTMSALALLPQPNVPELGPAALFSALKPQTHIPPHHGISNTRLLVHLPLIVPEHCGFRVGNEVRSWNVGSAFVFDDTIEHEAWNKSDQIRIVLIADIWSPFLSASERNAIAACMGAVGLFPAEAVL